jgi:hypothetical protein
MKTKLFVIKRHYDYEGFHILGIFDDEEKCDKYFEEVINRGDELTIEEYKLNVYEDDF